MELKYPDNYEQPTDALSKIIDIKVSDQYDISAQVNFDYPGLFFGLGILEKVQIDKNHVELEDLSMQLPVMPE